ncbi:helix-turn-helix domain-containing protein [Streptomyces chilikensis]|uniref:Helix-turn-helix transcriptional regulator n=1 Tax=Streptomyces chilikensis TaxID=1194079 RepID=A0ABV3ERK4_9ACTN
MTVPSMSCPPPHGGGHAPRRIPTSLTSRQREILILAANGNTNADIANWCDVTPHSVTEVLTSAYRRLGARDRAQAVAIALAVGEIGVHEIHIPDRQRNAA